MYKITYKCRSKSEMFKLNIINKQPKIPLKPEIILKPEINEIIPSISLNSNTNLSSKIKLSKIASDKNCQNLYSISNNGIYISNDYGKNWQLDMNSISLFLTAISCNYSGQYIIAAALQKSTTFGIIIYYSNDYGKTWNILPLNNKNEYCVSITFNSKSFLMLTSIGNIYESFDYGISWANKITIHNKCNYITSSYNGQYLFVTSLVFNGGGVYISNDYGINWNKQLIIDNCSSITTSYTGQYLAVTSNSLQNGGIYTSSDYGKTWTNRILFSTNWINITSDNSGQYLAATSFADNNGDIYLSNDFGVTWNKSNTFINNWKLIKYNKTGDFLLATTFNILNEEVNINTYKVLN